jgi:hypothetical protein
MYRTQDIVLRVLICVQAVLVCGVVSIFTMLQVASHVFRLPDPALLPPPDIRSAEEHLAWIVPAISLVVWLWWGLWWSHIRRSAPIVLPIVGILWAAYFGVAWLGHNWWRFGAAPDGTAYLHNSSKFSVVWDTRPSVYERYAAWRSSRSLSPGETIVLRDIPTDQALGVEARIEPGQLRVDVRARAGELIFCRELTPDDRETAQGRIILTPDLLECSE